MKDSREHGAAAFILKPFKPQKALEALMLFSAAVGVRVLRLQLD